MLIPEPSTHNNTRSPISPPPAPTSTNRAATARHSRHVKNASNPTSPVSVKHRAMVKVATMNGGTSTATKPTAAAPRPGSTGTKKAAAVAAKTPSAAPLKTSPAPAAAKQVAREDAPLPDVVVPAAKPVREAAATLEKRVAGENAEKEGAMKARMEVEKMKKGVEEEGEGKDVAFGWSACEAEKVLVTGSFGDWQKETELVKKGDAWEVLLKLKPGVYEYKFIVDGEWCYDITMPTVTDEGGNVNNVITV